MTSRYQAQAVLFSAVPSYAELTACTFGMPAVFNTVVINVWRNHAFEPLIPLIAPYAAFGMWTPDFKLSHYDDTLSFSEWQQAAAELVWVDLRRLTFDNREAAHLWLTGRLEYLRKLSAAPIVLATWATGYFSGRDLEDICGHVIDCYYADLEAIANDASLAFLDKRTEAFAGTALSRQIQPLLARQLACRWLPACFLPPIKAVALDLDQTLHQGVLGEDGPDGVVLTEAYKSLQVNVKQLSASGIFIALVSRNEYKDVEDLFSKRRDYPLRWSDFSAIEISWSHKGDALLRIAEKLRIAPDAILYMDDNPGELLSITNLAPSIHTIYADTDVDKSQRALEFYPGLWRWRVNDDDLRRLQDMKANELRKQAQEEHASEGKGYFSSLGVTLSLSLDDLNALPRMADLSGKTNQFNLSLKRYTQADLERKRKDEGYRLITASLQDDLSDSGIIALLIAKKEDRTLRVSELCISCRAMGRGLEDSIIFGALHLVAPEFDYDSVVFTVLHASRNQPSLVWLGKHLMLEEIPEAGEHILSVTRITQFQFPDGLQVKVQK